MISPWTYFQLVIEMGRNNPSWRAGQCYFNALHTLMPDLANEIRGTELDPFYKDDRLHDFLDWLRDKWEDQ